MLKKEVDLRDPGLCYSSGVDRVANPQRQSVLAGGLAGWWWEQGKGVTDNEGASL